MSIEELNNLIINSKLDFFGLDEMITFTPLIEKLTIKGPPSNICGKIERDKVRDRFIHNTFPENYELDTDLINSIVKFMVADNIPDEEKKNVSKYLNESVKKMIFDKYFEIFIRTNKFIDYDSFMATIDKEEAYSYHPRINGVPLEVINEQKQLLLKSEMNIKRLKDLLTDGISKIESFDEIITLKLLLDDNDYFEKDWCISYPKKLKKVLSSGEIEEKINSFCQNVDKFRVNELKNKNQVAHNININANLKKEILDSVPSEFNLLEKAIYIYIKLCQILSYDPIYYFNDKTLSHGEVSNIINYDSTNNKVVCYEFSYILADLLRSIGIEYIDEKSISNDKFNNSHANIKFLVDNMAIFADSTTSVEEGDMSNSKFDDQIKGIRCQMYEKGKQEKFRKSKEKVIQYLKEENKSFNSKLPTKEEVNDLDDSSKIILYNTLIANNNLTDIDLLSYANKLKSIISPKIKTKLYTDKSTNSNMYLKVIINHYNKDNRIEYIMDLKTREFNTVNNIDLISENEINSKGR